MYLQKIKFERLDQLIRLKATGTPKELARKFETTERTIFRMINELKEIGCPVYYNRERESYCYKFEGKLIIKFEQYVIDKESLGIIKGGRLKKINCTDIFCQ